MNSAIKIDSIYNKSTQNDFQNRNLHDQHAGSIHPVLQQPAPEVCAAGRNQRRLSLILEQENTDVFELFGWSELPDSIKSVIRTDLEAYRDELLGLYSTCDPGVRDRRKSISYWVKAWKYGLCSEQTAASSLSVSFCS
jgi:hypothetical protein